MLLFICGDIGNLMLFMALVSCIPKQRGGFLFIAGKIFPESMYCDHH